MKKVFIALSIVALLPFVVSKYAKAAPENNPYFATISEVEQLISSSVENIQQELEGLISRVDRNEEAIENIDQRVISLEENTIPDPLDFEFINGQVPTTGYVSPSIDIGSYPKVTWIVRCTIGGSIVSLFVSQDGISWIPQQIYQASECSYGRSITLSTAGRFYKVHTYATPDPELSVVSFGRFHY
jgi:hypothetical protein